MADQAVNALYRRLIAEKNAPTLFAVPASDGSVEYIRVLQANRSQMETIGATCSELGVAIELDITEGLVLGDRIPF